MTLIVLGFVAWAWFDASRARERAIRLGHELCAAAGLQLLDQTVSLRRLRVVRDAGLPALARRYGFEVSLDGSDRHRGHLDFVGARLDAWSLPSREPPPPPEPPRRPDFLRLVG